VTFAPSSTNACAQASPIPLLPPVTTTMRSRSSRSIARPSDALAAARGRDRGAKPEQVAVDAEARDLPLRDSGDHGVMAPFLPGVDVGHVHLDDRACQDGKSIADTVAVVGPRARVDQDAVDLVVVGLVNALAHLGLAVGLERSQLDAELPGERLELLVDLTERDRSVQLRIALSEHVEVDAVKPQELLHGFSYSMSTSTTRPVFAASTSASVTRRFCRPSRPVTSARASPRITAAKCSICSARGSARSKGRVFSLNGLNQERSSFRS